MLVASIITNDGKINRLYHSQGLRAWEVVKNFVRRNNVKSVRYLVHPFTVCK
jgi:hypothetical protein